MVDFIIIDQEGSAPSSAVISKSMHHAEIRWLRCGFTPHSLNSFMPPLFLFRSSF